MGGNTSGLSDFDDGVTLEAKERSKSIPRKRMIFAKDAPGGELLPPTPLLEQFDEKKNINPEELEKMSFDVTRDPKIDGDDENYGIVPINVLHNILLFQSLPDILAMSVTCRLFYVVCNTNYFWRSYYICTYKGEKDEENRELESPSSENYLNWKKQFYKRYFLYGDGFYRKKYKKLKHDDSNPPSSMSFRILVVGDSESGKTCFINRYLDGESYTHQEDLEGTIGLDYFTQILEYEVRNKQKKNDKENNMKSLIQIILFDVSGNKRFRSLASGAIRGAKGVIMTFGIDNREQFEDLGYWLDEIKLRSAQNINEVPILIVGTKSDLCKERKIHYVDDIQPLMKENRELRIGYVECSSKLNEGVIRAVGIVLDGMIDISRNRMVCSSIEELVVK